MTMDFTLDEEITLIKKQLLMRPTTRVMEGCNKASGGEVRRVNVIYYLSINGKIQHPHLIRVRVHHNGVRLRDVKRWLLDLRGKDMPDSFTWSYKRRYKMGYVWQDLMDDDLITPICDNEYVLMGSQLPCSPYPSSTMDASSCGEKTPKRDVEFKAAATDNEAKQPPTVDTPMEMDDGVPPRPPLQLEDGPPETNRCSEDSADAAKIDTPSLQEEEVQKQGEKQEGSLEREKRRKSDGRRSRSASRMVRGIITCGMGEANGTPLLPVSRRERVRDRQSFSPLHCITRMIPMCLRGPGNL